MPADLPLTPLSDMFSSTTTFNDAINTINTITNALAATATTSIPPLINPHKRIKHENSSGVVNSSSSSSSKDKISQTTVNITPSNIIPKVKRTATADRVVAANSSNTAVPRKIYTVNKPSVKVLNASTSAPSSSSSSSTAPTVAASSSSTNKTAFILRRYTHVPPTDVPSVSYNAYIALSDVRANTRRYLKASKVYDETATGGVPPPHTSPWHTIKHGSTPVQLQQCTDTQLGTSQYRVVCKQSVKRGQVLCWFGGELTEAEHLSETTRDTHSIILRNDFLKAYFEYNGPELAVNATAHRTVAYYIRDPIYSHSEETNCMPDVIYDDKSTLFYVFYFATRNITAGEEVFGLRHLGSWRNLNHRELNINARISHWQHQWCARLEAALLKHKVSPDTHVSINTKVVKPNEQERRVYWANELERISLEYVLGDGQAFRTLASQTDAFTADGCTQINVSEFGSTVSPKTADIMAHKGQFIPAAFFVKGKLYYVDRDRVKQLIKDGADNSLIEIKELIELPSPPRYYCPPWYKSHAVVAKKFIPAGTLICTYAGVLDQDVVNPGSMCAYNLFAEQCVQEFGPSYRAPNLLLDASKRGNIGKYINDCKFRDETSDEEAKFTNVKLLYVYDKMPHMMFYAVEDIEAGDELIQDYGHEFWNVISKQLMNEHWRFQNYILTYNARLLQLCQQHKIKLPDKPPYLLESTRQFSDKPLPYPNRWITFNSDKQSKVESILDRRADADGSNVQYLIQWRGFPTSMNSWEPDSQLDCDVMVRRYELLQSLASGKIARLNSDVVKNGLKSERDTSQSSSDEDSDDEDDATPLARVYGVSSVSSQQPVVRQHEELVNESPNRMSTLATCCPAAPTH